MAEILLEKMPTEPILLEDDDDDEVCISIVASRGKRILIFLRFLVSSRCPFSISERESVGGKEREGEKGRREKERLANNTLATRAPLLRARNGNGAA